MAEAAPETGIRVNSKSDCNTGEVTLEDETVAARISTAARDVVAKVGKKLAKPCVPSVLRDVLALVPGVKL